MFGKANNLTSKKHYVTETQTTNISNHVLGDDGDSSPEETMTPSSQSREDAAEPTSPPSSKVLRIGSWNVRTMYEAGKRAQVLAEMQRNKLHILGVSETHWNRSGQQHLGTGELFIFSGHEEDGPHRQEVGLLLSKAVKKTLRC